MTGRVSRPQALFFALMENLAVFDEVLMAVLDSGKMRIGMWGAHFLFGYERYYRRWLHGPFRPAFTRGRAERQVTPVVEVFRKIARLLECPAWALTPGQTAESAADAAKTARERARRANSRKSSSGAYGGAASWSPPFPRRFLIDYARRRLGELEGPQIASDARLQPLQDFASMPSVTARTFQDRAHALTPSAAPDLAITGTSASAPCQSSPDLCQRPSASRPPCPPLEQDPYLGPYRALAFRRRPGVGRARGSPGGS
ncbi:MAG: hypothetical protein IPK79_05590 [Vampirovibrionales bacterium]|nr:hypothetical protein [Vampirovibrionales bacterium]